MGAVETETISDQVSSILIQFLSCLGNFFLNFLFCLYNDFIVHYHGQCINSFHYFVPGFTLDILANIYQRSVHKTYNVPKFDKPENTPSGRDERLLFCKSLSDKQIQKTID